MIKFKTPTNKKSHKSNLRPSGKGKTLREMLKPRVKSRATKFSTHHKVKKKNQNPFPSFTPAFDADGEHFHFNNNLPLSKFEQNELNGKTAKDKLMVSTFDQNMLKKAEVIARFVHLEQFRHDEVTPYIEHVQAVVDGVEGVLAKTVAWLHDVVEDSDSIGIHELQSIYKFTPEIVAAVEALTKTDYESYKDYLQRVKNNDMARIVKKVDIRHNMETLDKSENRYGKYELALDFLEAPSDLD